MSLKVLMFGWEFPPHNSGGLGVACLGLTQALVQNGIDLTFVLPRKSDYPKTSLKMLFADNTKIKFAEIDSSLQPYLTQAQYKEMDFKVASIYGKTLLEEVRRYARAARTIAKQEVFDLIHAHDWLSFEAGIEAKKVSGKPLIVHVHSTEFDRSGGSNLNEEVYRIEKEGMEQADLVIAVSEYTKNIIIQNYGIDPQKIRVVYNGIDLDEWDREVQVEPSLMEFKRKGFFIVLFAGRITLQKGPDYFLNAARKVLDHNSKVIFIIAGSGDMQTQLMLQAAGMGISDKVFFAGFLKGEELNRVYKSADLFVLPSVSEPFGIAPLEAVVNGTPVIVSKQSGVSEVLTHALKVDFWDIDEMVNKILAVVEHQSLKKSLTNNSFEEVGKMSWTNPAQKCINIYSSLVGHY